jgi:hypothetical protein
MEPQTEEKKSERFVGDRVRDVVEAINRVLGFPLINSATVPELLLDMPKVKELPTIEEYAIHQAFHAVCDEADKACSEVGRLHEIIEQFGDRERPIKGTVGLLFAIAAKRTPEQLVVIGEEWAKDDARLPLLFKAVRTYVRAVREAPFHAMVRGLIRDACFEAFLSRNTLLVSELVASVPKENREAVLERFRKGVCDEEHIPTEERTRELFAEASKS